MTESQAPIVTATLRAIQSKLTCRVGDHARPKTMCNDRRRSGADSLPARLHRVCPAVGCGQPAAILYGGGIFACRHYYRLAYASSREDAGGRATR
jgi:hypothetical protein